MDEEELMGRLRALGFTEYQSRGYLAAVQLGTARPGELAEEADIPQARIYDVIDDLEETGLVEVQEQSGGKRVTAPAPSAALEALRQRRISELSETVESAIAGLEQLHTPSAPGAAFVTMVSRRASALRHVRRAIDDADWWLTLALPYDLYEDVADEVAAAIDRGVNVRLALPTEDAQNRDLEFPPGLSVRHRLLGDAIAVADRSYGVFTSDDPRTEETPYIVTQEPNLAFLFQNFFQQFWPASAELQSGGGFPRRYLDPWRAIVDLKDELDAGADLVATVEGYHTRKRRTGRWTGPVVDYELSGPVITDYTQLMPEKAALFVEVDGDVHEVGGRKATAAHLAADGLEIDRR